MLHIFCVEIVLISISLSLHEFESICITIHIATSDAENDCFKCVSGFPDMPVFEVGGRTDSSSVITTLIPGMHFTHQATIAGFMVAGTMFENSKIQIWQQNTSYFQIALYDRVADIMVNPSNCVSWSQVVDDVVSCILYDRFQVSVQPGDFIGLKLPKTADDNGIHFTESRGPTNYVFHDELTSPIELNDSDDIKAQQPQIAFSLTLGIIDYYN